MALTVLSLPTFQGLKKLSIMLPGKWLAEYSLVGQEHVYLAE